MAGSRPAMKGPIGSELREMSFNQIIHILSEIV
jgi:hypothetical protein